MSIYDYQKSDYAFVVGNGINRLNNKLTKSWMEIVSSIEPKAGINYVDGYPLPEYFDLLSLYDKAGDDKVYRTRFLQEVDTLDGSLEHKRLYEYCSKQGIDILTTNFDHAFQKSNGLEKKQLRSLSKGFSDYYPWQVFYGKGDCEEQGCKLYHINGDIAYKRSIKLSVKDYAGNIMNFDHKYQPKVRDSQFHSDRTWLNILFDKKIVIVGLALGEEEIFIRNILINRKIYRNINNLDQSEAINGYYLYCTKDFSNNTLDKYRLFFEAVGIEMIGYDDYAAMYQ